MTFGMSGLMAMVNRSRVVFRRHGFRIAALSSMTAVAPKIADVVICGAGLAGHFEQSYSLHCTLCVMKKSDA